MEITEIEVEDMVVGYESEIPFKCLQNDFFQHAATFRKMATPDGTSYVIIYQWADRMTKTFNGREEAFYIDNVNEANQEKAREIFNAVYNRLCQAFQENPDDVYQMEPMVNEVVSTYSSTNTRGRH